MIIVIIITCHVYSLSFFFHFFLGTGRSLHHKDNIEVKGERREKNDVSRQEHVLLHFCIPSNEREGRVKNKRERRDVVTFWYLSLLLKRFRLSLLSEKRRGGEKKKVKRSKEKLPSRGKRNGYIKTKVLWAEGNEIEELFLSRPKTCLSSKEERKNNCMKSCVPSCLSRKERRKEVHLRENLMPFENEEWEKEDSPRSELFEGFTVVIKSPSLPADGARWNVACCCWWC